MHSVGIGGRPLRGAAKPTCAAGRRRRVVDRPGRRAGDGPAPRVKLPPMTMMDDARAGADRRLSRREWALVALGLVAWLAIGAGGAWFAHQVTQPRQACAAPADAPTHQAKGGSSAGPRNGFQAITGQGRCR